MITRRTGSRQRSLAPALTSSRIVSMTLLKGVVERDLGAPARTTSSGRRCARDSAGWRPRCSVHAAHEDRDGDAELVGHRQPAGALDLLHRLHVVEADGAVLQAHGALELNILLGLEGALGW